MKAAVFYDKEDIKLESIPDPSYGDDQVVVKVKACGICGSDLEYFYARSPVGTPTGKGPLVLGHEFTGEIVEMGGAAKKSGTLKIGDRVVFNPIQSCNACDKCRSGTPQFCRNLSVLGVTTNGGFAEYAVSHYQHAYKLPDGMPYDVGALVEPLAAAYHAVGKLEIDTDSYVAIFGPGPLGLAMVRMAKARGARTVVMIGTRDYRLQMAKDMGADEVINVKDKGSRWYTDNLAERIREIGRGELANRVIVPASSVPAHDEAFRISSGGAILVFLAVLGPNDKVGIPMLESLILDKTIKFSLWYPNQFPRTIDFLEQHQDALRKIITHREELGSLVSSIRRVAGRDDSVVKTIIQI